MGVAINRPQNAINTVRFNLVRRPIIHLGPSSTSSQKQCLGEMVPARYRRDCDCLLKTRFMVNRLTEFGPIYKLLTFVNQFHFAPS
jgi:hypothetical protein